jgi:hypothetical protein
MKNSSAFMVGVASWCLLTACQLKWLPLDWWTVLQAVWATIATLVGWRIGTRLAHLFRCWRMVRRLRQSWQGLTVYERRVLHEQGIYSAEQWLQWRMANNRSGSIERTLESINREQDKNGINKP